MIISDTTFIYVMKFLVVSIIFLTFWCLFKRDKDYEKDGDSTEVSKWIH